MSKLAKKPFSIPARVEVTSANDAITIKGKAGTLVLSFLPFTKTTITEKEITVAAAGTGAQARANTGTMAALVRNALQGAAEGFTKALEIEGIGFKAAMEGGGTLVLTVGFTHPIKFAVPESVKITVIKNIITISGADRSLVGQVAAQIRKIKKPEPYKGKGIHYQGEVIRRKAGKKVAGATGTAAA